LRKLFSNRIFLLILTTLLILAVIIFSSIPGNPIHSITTPVSVFLDPVQKAVQGAGNSVSDFFSAITDGMSLRKENDSLKEFEQIAKFIARIDKNIPWHISRFFPMYQMDDKEKTSLGTLKKAEKIGKKYLNNVYLGNI